MALLPVTNTSGKGSAEIVGNLTILLQKRLLQSGRFHFDTLTEFNPTIKRLLDDKALPAEAVQAYRTGPSIETATPLALATGVKFVLSVSVQDAKEVFPSPEELAALKKPAKRKSKTAAEAEPAATPEQVTPEWVSPQPGETESKPKKKGARAPKRKPPVGPHAVVTLMGQMWCFAGGPDTPAQIYKSVLVAGSGKPWPLKSRKEPSLIEGIVDPELEYEALEVATGNLVQELLREPKKTKKRTLR